ncbi:MAG: hypothetical protein IJS78_05530 [Clostridia bacterium]|nr:hypothetical protein [Clostridia bacterium]
MSDFLTTLLKLSIAASILIGVVALFRLVFSRSPKWIRGILWTMVAVRLLVPFFPESPVGVVPREITVDYAVPAALTGTAAETESPSQSRNAKTAAPASPAVPSASGASSPSVAILPPSDPAADPAPTADPQPAKTESSVFRFDLTAVLFSVWAAGVTVMLSYAFISRIRLKRLLRASVETAPGVFASDYVSSPFVLGVFRPRIYVPSSLCGDELGCVLRHERAHVVRRDDLSKMIGFLILSAYWFCPTVWIGYVLFCRDVEYACDERAMRGTNAVFRAAYSKTLVEFGTRRQPIAGPLGFGKIGVTRRVKNVLNYKKPTFWIIVGALLICAVIGVCFLTSPKKAEAVPPGTETDGVVEQDPEYELTEAEKQLAEYARRLKAFVDGDAETLCEEGNVPEGYRALWREKFLELYGRSKIVLPDKFDRTSGNNTVTLSVEGDLGVGLLAGTYDIDFNAYRVGFSICRPEARPFRGGAAEEIPGGWLAGQLAAAYLPLSDPATATSVKVRTLYPLVFSARSVYPETTNGALLSEEDFIKGLEEFAGIKDADLSRLDRLLDGDGNYRLYPTDSVGLACDLINVKETENGYDFTYLSYADRFCIIASDTFVVSLLKSDGDYPWVFGGISIVGRGEIPPEGTVADFSDSRAAAEDTFGDSHVGAWADDPIRKTNEIVVFGKDGAEVKISTGIDKIFSFTCNAVPIDGVYRFGDGVSYYSGPSGVAGTVLFREGCVIVRYDSFGEYEDDFKTMDHTLVFGSKVTDEDPN